MRARAKKSRDDRNGIKILAASIIFIIAIVMLNKWVESKQIETDDTTLCPTKLSSDTRSHTMILVDSTDAMTERQAEYLRTIIEKTRNDMATHDRLSVALIDEEHGSSEGKDASVVGPRYIGSNVRFVFSACKPEEGGEKANSLYQNPKLMKRSFEDKFKKPLDEAIRGLLAVTEAAHSPIAQAIDDVTRWPEFAQFGHRRIELVSDMLQNTPPITDYIRPGRLIRDIRDVSDLKPPNLVDTEVSITYLIRPMHNNLQGDEHLNRWQKLLTRGNASKISIRAKVG